MTDLHFKKELFFIMLHALRNRTHDKHIYCDFRERSLIIQLSSIHILYTLIILIGHTIKRRKYLYIAVCCLYPKNAWNFKLNKSQISGSSRHILRFSTPQSSTQLGNSDPLKCRKLFFFIYFGEFSLGIRHLGQFSLLHFTQESKSFRGLRPTNHQPMFCSGPALKPCINL